MIENALSALLRATVPHGTRITTVKPVPTPTLVVTKISDEPAGDEKEKLAKVIYRLDLINASPELAQSLFQKLQDPWNADGSGGLVSYTGIIDRTAVKSVEVQEGILPDTALVTLTYRV
jgi:hypothetical protein